jgi:hemolysin activation/secretion protein
MIRRPPRSTQPTTLFPYTTLFRSDVTRFTGEIRQGELAWVYPLSGSFNHRWNLTSKVDYTHKDYEITLLSLQVQKQEYGSAEIGTDYSRIVALGDQRVDISAALAVRSGLGEDHTDNDIRAADFGYLLFRPSLSITVPFGESFTAGLGLAAQITDDTLPEQQQWVMGGVGNVEAYLPGVAAGDSGGLARLFGQTRFEVMGLPVTPRVFAEYGYSKLENPFEPPFVAVAQSGSTQTVIDAGVSLSVQVTRWLETRFSYAESLDESKIDQEALDATDANIDRKSTRLNSSHRYISRMPSSA